MNPAFFSLCAALLSHQPRAKSNVSFQQQLLISWNNHELLLKAYFSLVVIVVTVLTLDKWTQ
jgi:hypothetical protein